jgi:hypothetical protein
VASIDEVRREVARWLELDRLDDDLWAILLRQRYEQDALEQEVGTHDFDSEIELLAGRYKELKEAQATGRRGQPQAGRERRVVAADQRLKVLAQILALEAARVPAVALWRDIHLPDGTIERCAVGDWVISRALPLEATTSFATVPLPPGFPSRPSAGRYAEWLEGLAEAVRRLDLQPPSKPTGQRFEHLQFLAPDLWPDEIADWLDEGEPASKSEEPRVQRVRVSPGDELWDLHDLSNQLSMRYGWSPAEATNFMLTGTPPLVAKGGAHVHRRSPFDALTRIGLEVDPRMSALEVKRLYSEARAWIRTGGDRKMTEKHLQLALFIAEDGSRVPHALGIEAESRTWRDAGHASASKLGALAPDSAESRDTWPRLQDKWNEVWRETHPDWCYHDAQARQFSRDIRDAWKRVTGQEWWNPKTVEEHQARQKRKPKRKRDTG